MTTYALVLWTTLTTYQVMEVGLDYDQCSYAEDVLEMETGSDLACIPTYKT